MRPLILAALCMGIASLLLTMPVAAVDTTLPTVNLNVPANGAKIFGSIDVSATAADNVGVVGVQFKLDGANLGAEDTSAPFAIVWNTTSATNASHSVSAVARDAAGNTKTATVTVTVDNVNWVSPYAAWPNSFPTDENYFPLTVWLQGPQNAQAFKNLGINTFIGLWDGPTEAQLSALTSANMPVVCDQNSVALASANKAIIKAWMHGDEPDNAQPLPGGGYGPPILPQVIIDGYNSIKSQDASRPVLLNLGQGVAWDGWYGRGTRTNHPEDYPEYIKGSDIVSFDIYPVTSPDAAVTGNLWYVGYGVERLVQWTQGRKIVWNCIETTHINSQVLPTPEQIRSEVWMSIIHGSKGIIYFVHEWYPSFSEPGILRYPANMQAVTNINAQIKSLAPVLNSPTIAGAVTANSSNVNVPLKVMHKRYGTANYLLVVAMRNANTTGTFTITGLTGTSTAEVLGENRNVTVTNGVFSDPFLGYGVHLYRIATPVKKSKDFDGDKKDDVLLRHPSTGTVNLWLMK